MTDCGRGENLSRLSSTRYVLVCLGAALAAAGCGRAVDTNDLVANVNSTNIERLANLYTGYQSENNWRGPADEAAFKGFIRSFDPKKLQRIGVDPAAIDAMFTSERDEQPFKIKYSVPGSAMGSAEPVIFESVGVDGLRQVGFLDMTEREVDEAEYQTLWAGKTQPAGDDRSY